jgi:hypothetical protein
MQIDQRLSPRERSRLAAIAAAERSKLKKAVEVTEPRIEPKPAVALVVAPQAQVTSDPPARKPEAPESPARPLVEPLLSSIELWVEVVDRKDRDVFGWVFIADRKIDRKALGITLNSHHWLSKLALSGAEPKALSWVFANLLVESLMSGQQQRPWKREVVDHLRRRVFESEEQKSFSRLWFTERLAEAKVFAGIRELIAGGYGKQKIFTLRLDENAYGSPVQ